MIQILGGRVRLIGVLAVLCLAACNASPAAEESSLTAVDLAQGILPAFLPEGPGIHLVADFADLLLDLVFDRQAVAIPAGHVRRMESGQLS